MKKSVLFLLQLLGLLLFCQVGNYIAEFFHLPIPGNVIGMILLFLLLQMKMIKLEWVDLTSSFLVKHLALFFIPISVSLMTMGGLFLKFGLPLALALVISLIAGFISTAWTIQKLSREKVETSDNVHHHL